MATIMVTPSRNLVDVSLIITERSGSASTSTNTSIVDWQLIVDKHPGAAFNTDWTEWGTKIYATIDFQGCYDDNGNPVSKNVYIPEYNYNNRHLPGSVFDSGHFTVTHNDDGSKSIYCGLSFTDKANGVSDKGNLYTPGNAAASYKYVDLTKIPRFATVNHSLYDKEETTITVDWSSDNVCDYIWYSKDNKQTWSNAIYVNNTSGRYTISGLTSDSEYKIYTRVRRKDSQQTTDSSVLTVRTHKYPSLNYIPSFTVGNDLVITLNNPKNRECVIYFIDNTNTETYAKTTTSSQVSGFTNTPDWKTILYNSLPNSSEGTFKIRLTCDTGSVDETSVGVKYYLDMSDQGFNPVFDSSNITDIKNKSYAYISGEDKFIKGHNQLEFIIHPMTTSRGATPSFYSINSSGVSSVTKQYSSENITVRVNNIVSSNFSVTAYDKRGANKSVTKNIELIDYDKPSVERYTISRQNGNTSRAVLDFSGRYTDWSGLDESNSISRISYRTKLSSNPSWSGIGYSDLPSSAISYSNGHWYLNCVLNDTFLTTNRYDIQLRISDTLESYETPVYQLSTADSLMWRDLLNKRVGIKKKPDKTFDVGGDIGLDGNLSAGGYLYSIGAITSENYLHGRLFSYDNRNTNEYPSYYYEKGRGIINEFKYSSVIGSPLNSTFVNLLTISPWSDSSGGLPIQIASSTAGIKMRTAAGSNSWNIWAPLISYLDMLNMVYPVGSIYMSVNGTSPASLFGGKWERIKDKFLLCSGDYYSPGTTGGSSTHTHSGPSHQHLVYGHLHGLSDNGYAKIHHNSSYFWAREIELSTPWTDTSKIGSISGSTVSTSNVYGTALGGTTDYNPNAYTEYAGTGSTGSGSSMPPYLAVYIWKRLPD